MTRSGSPSLHAILEELSSEDDLVSSKGESSSSPLPIACNTVMVATPVMTTPPLEETRVFQTAPMRQQWTTTPTPFPERLVAHQKER
jgi:hypothetical protein